MRFIIVALALMAMFSTASACEGDDLPHYSKYRMRVTKNAGANYWCTEELTFYDENGKRIATPASGASAETEFAKQYDASHAFNEIWQNNWLYYCSKNMVKTGWLQYDFGHPQPISKYEVQRLIGHGNQYSPVDWTFEGSNDGETWDILEEQGGHDTWKDGEVKTFFFENIPTATFSKYRIDVTKNAGAPYWCVKEFFFYDEDGVRLNPTNDGGKAETEFSAQYAAKRAFNENTAEQNHLYYCSKNGIKTGWLAFDFGKPTTISKYGLQRLICCGNIYSPVDWKFQGSNDGVNWQDLAEESDHNIWHDGEVKEFTLDCGLASSLPNCEDPDVRQIRGAWSETACDCHGERCRKADLCYHGTCNAHPEDVRVEVEEEMAFALYQNEVRTEYELGSGSSTDWNGIQSKAMLFIAMGIAGYLGYYFGNKRKTNGYERV
jgi:hypothetical protein